MGLIGGLSSDIASLSELQTLDLSNNAGLSGSLTPSIGKLTKLSILILDGCSFSGQIPDTIGSLKELTYLSLYSNRFTGSIPASIGNLINLYWLDLTNNNLTGNIPVSNGTTPGLDLLVGTKHFHFGKNQLNGTIPAQLFSSNMALIHVLFDSNQLTGSIPSTLGLVQTLEVVRLDRNHLNGSVPSNLSSLTSVGELHLSNNVLTGPIPNLTGMNSLNYLDLSNNTFDKSDVPLSYSTFQSLTTLMMENTNLQGQVPSRLFSLPELQTVVLSNNQLNGTLDTGSSNSNQLQLIDLQNNNITNVTQTPGNDVELVLNGNPVCTKTGGSESYCTSAAINASYSTPPNNCTPSACNSNKISSPNCTCAHPYTGVLIFRACSFSDLGLSSYYVALQESMMNSFKSNYLPVDSISLSNPRKDSNDYLELNLKIFPSGLDSFNHTGVSWIGFVLSSQGFTVPDVFGPFFFQATSYSYFADASTGSKKSSNTGIVIGASIGGSVLVLLVICVGVYALHQRRRAERVNEQSNPFASWDPNKGAGGVPEIKGVQSFSFQELKKYANNFDEANSIGLGGYGKVYKGTLPNGQLVAIKRAQQGSLQGGLEFKTEIELLSRVHHKNLVSLVGFCFERGEQMLVYEYIPNGTLKDCLSGKLQLRLEWMRRLEVALDSARGLAYLHELANPPIIHRDIKSTNILLDEHLRAKVSDFGLSKLLGDTQKEHVTTQVKGTMGYLDPEYYMTQELTVKSDVYSFGVVLLELITARSPIERGKHIVREVKTLMDKTKTLYDLYEILDPVIAGTSLGGLEQFVDLAMRCVEESASERPIMGEVVKEIENIMKLASVNPKVESAFSSASYEEADEVNVHLYSNTNSFAYSAAFPPFQIEPQ